MWTRPYVHNPVRGQDLVAESLVHHSGSTLGRAPASNPWQELANDLMVDHAGVKHRLTGGCNGRPISAAKTDIFGNPWVCWRPFGLQGRGHVLVPPILISPYPLTSINVLLVKVLAFWRWKSPGTVVTRLSLVALFMLSPGH